MKPCLASISGAHAASIDQGREAVVSQGRRRVQLYIVVFTGLLTGEESATG